MQAVTAAGGADLAHCDSITPSDRYLMRELERPPYPPPPPRRIAILGAGRLGTVLATGARAAGISVLGPLRRGEIPPADPEATLDAALLCVPDTAIAAVAATIPPGVTVGHCSGATGLAVLGARGGFSLHPLMTVPVGAAPELLRGAGAAVAGTDPARLALAEALAAALGLRAVRIAEADRPAYHAAASLAANFTITVEAFAEQLAATAGLSRAELAPLVRAAVDNWAAQGPERALTGPVARGDETTIALQRAAVAERLPGFLGLWDALLAATRELAGRRTITC